MIRALVIVLFIVIIVIMIIIISTVMMVMMMMMMMMMTTMKKISSRHRSIFCSVFFLSIFLFLLPAFDSFLSFPCLILFLVYIVSFTFRFYVPFIFFSSFCPSDTNNCSNTVIKHRLMIRCAPFSLHRASDLNEASIVGKSA